MKITEEELRARGFWRAGTVYPDPVNTLRVEISRDAHAFVVYVMVGDQELMKAGKTETSMSVRMRSTFNSLKNKMGAGLTIRDTKRRRLRNTPKQQFARIGK